jgi:hypothetical protein
MLFGEDAGGRPATAAPSPVGAGTRRLMGFSIEVVELGRAEAGAFGRFSAVFRRDDGRAFKTMYDNDKHSLVRRVGIEADNVLSRHVNVPQIFANT